MPAKDTHNPDNKQTIFRLTPEDRQHFDTIQAHTQLPNRAAILRELLRERCQRIQAEQVSQQKNLAG